MSKQERMLRAMTKQERRLWWIVYWCKHLHEWDVIDAQIEFLEKRVVQYVHKVKSAYSQQ